MPGVIEEPLGGAHRDDKEMTRRVADKICEWIDELQAMPTDQLLEARYQKFRNMGKPPRT